MKTTQTKPNRRSIFSETIQTRRSNLVRFASVLCLAAWAAGPQAAAQTPLGLSIQMNAGQAQLSVTGEVDTVCQLQWTDNLSTTSRWYHLDHCVLSSSPSLLTDSTSSSATGRYYRAVWTPNTNLVWIPPGTFTMGSPTNEADRFDNEGPQTVVAISRGIWMGKYLVTQGEYEAVMGINPSYFIGVRNWPVSGTDYGFEPTRPVEEVTWHETTNYCAQLTQQERTAGQIPAGYGYRLPTEAEWEYACRAGTSTRFSYGDDPGYTELANYAWYWDNSDKQTHPVRQKLPNPWGVYDIHGNVLEWCQDFYSENLPGGIAIDPLGPGTGSSRVFRGGSWCFWGNESNARYCRSALRGGFDPGVRAGGYLGFRVVLAPGQP